jgi:hypothetical protein
MLMPRVIEETRKNGAHESGIGLPHSKTLRKEGSHGLSRQRLGVRQPYAAVNSGCWGRENQFAAEIHLLTSATTHFVRVKRPVFAYFQR